MKPPVLRLASSISALLVLAGGALILTLAGCDSDNGTAPVPPGPPLSDLVISPGTDTLQGSESQQFTAQAYDTLGAPIVAPLQWHSTNTNVFTVTGGGLVTGRGEGSAKLVVSSGGKSDTAHIYVYADTGWVLQPGGGGNLNGVFMMADGQVGYAVGDGGRVVRTTNAGALWSTEISNTGYNLNAVWVTEAGAAWAVGDQSTVLQRTGSSWARVPGANTLGTNLNDIVFVNADTAWAACDDGFVARSFDGGTSWSKVKLPTAFDFRGIARVGARSGYAVGHGGTIAVTHDQGVTWYLVFTPTIQSLEGVAPLGANGAIAVGATGTVLRTVAIAPDSLQWELVVPSAGANNQLEGVWAVDASLVFAVGYNASVGGTILRSDDGGTTWQAQASHTFARLNEVHLIDSQRGWAVGAGGVIVHTARGGGH